MAKKRLPDNKTPAAKCIRQGVYGREKGLCRGNHCCSLPPFSWSLQRSFRFGTTSVSSAKSGSLGACPSDGWAGFSVVGFRSFLKGGICIMAATRRQVPWWCSHAVFCLVVYALPLQLQLGQRLMNSQLCWTSRNDLGYNGVCLSVQQ